MSWQAMPTKAPVKLAEPGPVPHRTGCWRRTIPAASSRPAADAVREAQALVIHFHAQFDAARRNRDRRREEIGLRQVRHARHHAHVPAVLLVVRYVQIVELRRVVVTHEPRRLLEVRRLELHRGDRAVAMCLLTTRHQRLPENTADGFAAIQPQVPGACAQAEQFLGPRRAQPLEVDGQLAAVEVLANRGGGERRGGQCRRRRLELRQSAAIERAQPVVLAPDHLLDRGLAARARIGRGSAAGVRIDRRRRYRPPASPPDRHGRRDAAAHADDRAP